MRRKVYPEGFDPMIASGPPTEDDIRIGLNWTAEETEAMQALELQAVTEDANAPRIKGRWYRELTDDEK